MFTCAAGRHACLVLCRRRRSERSKEDRQQRFRFQADDSENNQFDDAGGRRRGKLEAGNDRAGAIADCRLSGKWNGVKIFVASLANECAVPQCGARQSWRTTELSPVTCQLVSCFTFGVVATFSWTTFAKLFQVAIHCAVHVHVRIQVNYIFWTSTFSSSLVSIAAKVHRKTSRTFARLFARIFRRRHMCRVKLIQSLGTRISHFFEKHCCILRNIQRSFLAVCSA